jgi:hypothetical protein
MVLPTHTVLLPVMGDGGALTVKMVVLTQPAGVVKLIITTPEDMPVTTPEVESIVAIVVSLLLHEPPGSGSVNDAVAPTHNWLGPDMGPGNAFTVTTTGAEGQPVSTEKVIAEVPGNMPVTTPDVLPTVATDVLLLFQVPVPAISDNAVVCPWQMLSGLPVGADGGLTTLMAVVAEHPVPIV